MVTNTKGKQFLKNFSEYQCSAINISDVIANTTSLIHENIVEAGSNQVLLN